MTQAHLLCHIALSTCSLFLLCKRLKLKKCSKSWKENCIFSWFWAFFFNSKRLYSKNKEKFESAIWLKRCAWVSTFMRTSIESLKIKNKTYGHFCIKKNKKPGLERPLELWNVTSLIIMLCNYIIMLCNYIIILESNYNNLL